MTAKPQIHGGSGARAGVPLARAQRLAARVERPRRRRRVWPILALALALPGFAGAVALMPEGLPLDVGGPARIAAVTDTALAPDPLTDLPRLPERRPDLRALVIPCVARVEARLADLHATAQTEEARAARQDGLSRLVQATLDCRAAGLEIEGSLELAEMGLADIRVTWQRDSSRLRLTVVDDVPAGGAQVAFSEDGLPVEFVIR